MTYSPSHTNVGFNTGDVLCYSPISGKYCRLNRAGAIHKFGVTCVKWIPGSENLLIVGFEDGSMMILDKDLEDQNTPITSTPEEYSIGARIYLTSSWNRYLMRKAPKGSKNNPRTYWKVSRKSVSCISHR